MTDSGRTSLSVNVETKERLDTLRRQLSAHENADMTANETLTRLLDEFDDAHEWADTHRS